MKPQNDIELSTAISAIVQNAGTLNRLTSEGRLYQVVAVAKTVREAAEKIEQRVAVLVDMAA